MKLTKVKTAGSYLYAVVNGKEYRTWRGIGTHGVQSVYERKNAAGKWGRVDFCQAHNVCYELLLAYRKAFNVTI